MERQMNTSPNKLNKLLCGENRFYGYRRNPIFRERGKGQSQLMGGENLNINAI
jgi:hypothetical protein